LLNRLLARELSNPSDILGKFVLGPLWNYRNAALNDAAFKTLALCPDDRVLEVGFGGGYLLRRLGAVVTHGLLVAVDISPAMVAYVQQRERTLVAEGRLVLKCAPADQLPVEDASFSKICSVNSIFYWKDPQHAFAEMHRVATQGSILVLCFTDKRSLNRKSFARNGLSLYELEDIQRMIEQAGFHVDSARSFSDKHRQFWCLKALYNSYAAKPIGGVDLSSASVSVDNGPDGLLLSSRS
jgi:ubiquinone/menaquinone biosynthesis C-methylase UbiE